LTTPPEQKVVCPICGYNAGSVNGKEILRQHMQIQHPSVRERALSVHDALASSPLETAISEANSQLAEDKFGDYTLSKGWFFKEKLLGGYDSFKAVDLCWAFPTKVTTKAYAVVTTGVRWDMTLNVRPHKTVKLSHESGGVNDKLPSASVDYALKALSQIIPWAIFGYSNYRAECWGKYHDVFLKVIDERLDVVRAAVNSGMLEAGVDGMLVAKKAVNMPILTYKFRKTDSGKVAGREYQSSTDARETGTTYYRA